MRNIFHRFINGQLNRIRRVQHAPGQQAGATSTYRWMYNMAMPGRTYSILFSSSRLVPSPSPSPSAVPFPLAASQFGVSFMWVNVARAKLVNKRATQRPLIWLSAFDCEK